MLNAKKTKGKHEIWILKLTTCAGIYISSLAVQVQQQPSPATQATSGHEHKPRIRILHLPCAIIIILIITNLLETLLLLIIISPVTHRLVSQPFLLLVQHRQAGPQGERHQESQKQASARKKQTHKFTSFQKKKKKNQ
jgi:membrane protein required for beta-lactamase induction